MTTFLQYLTRKTGFGRTPWPRAILIFALAIAMIAGGLSIVIGGDPWGVPLIAIGLGVVAIMFGGTLSNWKTDKAREDAGPNNKHRSDVLEEADPVRWKKDGAPLMELHIWYAATRDETWEEAAQYLAQCPKWQHDELVKDHARYLKRNEFDKFLRK